MYVPKQFAETDMAHLSAIMCENPFGLLVTYGASGLEATHVPMEWKPGHGEAGVISGHMAKANPQWRAFDGSEVCAVFSGPHAYVSPRWYAAPANVPTWNYVSVHAYGIPRVIADPRQTIADIVTRLEAGAEAPWSIAEAPQEYVERLYEHVVAFEMPVTRLEGKRKLGQNRAPAVRRGAIAALRGTGNPMDAQVADLMDAVLD